MSFKILKHASCCGTGDSDTTDCDCAADSNCCDPGTISTDINGVACPVCGKTGVHVENVTVKHMVKKELIDAVSDEEHWLCMSEECEVAYYTGSNVEFNKEDIKVPIWFKKDANPKYACYCNNITEEQVIETVVNKGLDNMKDIIVSINGKVISQCKVRNPAGKCCTQAFNEAIRKGMEIRNKE